MPRSDGYDDNKGKAKADYMEGKAEQGESWGSKENLFSPGQLTPSDKYKENGSKIFNDPKWHDF